MAEPAREQLPPWLGRARLAIGLVQGLILYGLSHAQAHNQFPWTVPALFSALALAGAFAPLIVIGGLGSVRPITLALWAAAATVLIAGLAWYGVVRGDNDANAYQWFSPLLAGVIAILVFTGHHLVAAGDASRRVIAPYDRYFDLGWRHGAQLVLACLFTGAFWAVLGIGAALFNLIKLSFLSDLIQRTWFNIPATTIVFAAAIHLTDLRSGLVRGVRALGLILLSWLLPVMAALAAAFLLALLVTGLAPLWGTRAATSLLLSAAGALVVLINATYQDGAPEHPPAFILRWAARAGAVVMTPLAALAGYALFLRIGQYGLTPERIFAAAVLAVGCCYAVAYLLGAFSKTWMKPLELGNIISAFVVMAVLIVLFSPIGDPARLSVDDQMHRLGTGRTPQDKFDYAFLRFGGARYGHDALVRLRDDRSTPRAQQMSDAATRALALQNRYDYAAQHNVGATPPPLYVNMHPANAALPQDFLTEVGADGIVNGCESMSAPCDGVLVDMNGDGVMEVLIAEQGGLSIYALNREHHWVMVANDYGVNDAELDAIRKGEVRVIPSLVGDLMLGDHRFRPSTQGEADWPDDAPEQAPSNPSGRN